MTDATSMIRTHAARRTRLMEARAEIDADLKELDLEGKALGLNTAEINKWVAAQMGDKVVKRRDTVADAVMIGEVLGVEFGFDGRETGTVQKSEADGLQSGMVQDCDVIQ